MTRDICYILLGYAAGSILFACVFGIILKKDVYANSSDYNPGTTNAYKNGGFWCGTLTLLGDIFKGFFPVFLYFRGPYASLSFLVIAAPVIGHVLPVFHKFRGGKGIATTFGCLLGLLPVGAPVICLAFYFLLFSLLLYIPSRYYRTLVTYLCTAISVFVLPLGTYVKFGMLAIAVCVTVKMLCSREEKSDFEVKPIWKR